MHVVHKTRGFLSNWEKSGEAEWYGHPCSVCLFPSNSPFLLSRKYLTQLHSTPTDTNAADALVTTYHTLLSATLSLWPSEHPLSPPAFTAFVKSMLLSLPSSSQVASSPAAAAFGELLIDTMWSIDSQLDDVIADSKATIAAQSEKEKENEQTNSQSEDSGALLSRDAATKDKGTLLELVKLLLVR
jgi:THO complex subunit 2